MLHKVGSVSFHLLPAFSLPELPQACLLEPGTLEKRRPPARSQTGPSWREWFLKPRNEPRIRLGRIHRILGGEIEPFPPW